MESANMLSGTCTNSIIIIFCKHKWRLHMIFCIQTESLFLYKSLLLFHSYLIIRFLADDPFASASEPWLKAQYKVLIVS